MPVSTEVPIANIGWALGRGCVPRAGGKPGARRRCILPLDRRPAVVNSHAGGER